VHVKTTVAKKRYMNNQSQRGRSPVKRDQIANYIREQVISGKWQPGQLIPSRLELEQMFETTPVTVQRAVKPLIEDGFLCAEGRRGTFVSETPPHLTRFALVFPHDLQNPKGESAFFKTLAHAADILCRRDGLDIVPFYKLYGDLRCQEYLELVREVNAGKLAGIIFATNPFLLENTPVLDRPGIPRVAFMAGAVYPNVKAISVHRAALREKALRHISACGKRRPCVILPKGHYVAGLSEHLIEFADSMGLSLRPEWIQFVDQGNPWTCENLARLLFSSNVKIRPDSIFIGDDNTIAPILKGLRIELAEEASELTICAHSNFPSEICYDLPVKRFGYNITELLRQAIDMVVRQRNGEEVGDVVAEPVDDTDAEVLTLDPRELSCL
jgi:DNA-binding transcriptional regulator YhcF (GntR family)/DNA-binding LacI/PurR family transcriptional regulator